MALGQPALVHHGLDFGWQLEQAQQVGDGGAVPADHSGDLALRELDGEPVEDRRVAPLHGQVRHGALETLFDVPLDRAQRPHVTAAGERWRIEREDDLDKRSAGSVRRL